MAWVADVIFQMYEKKKKSRRTKLYYQYDTPTGFVTKIMVPIMCDN